MKFLANGIVLLIFGSTSFATETADQRGFYTLPKHDHPEILAVHDTLAVYNGTQTMPKNIWPRPNVFGHGLSPVIDSQGIVNGKDFGMVMLWKSIETTLISGFGGEGSTTKNQEHNPIC